MKIVKKTGRVSGISYGTGCEIPMEGTWVLNKPEPIVNTGGDLKKYLAQNQNEGLLCAHTYPTKRSNV